MTTFQHEDLTAAIIRAFYLVYNTLGPGMPELVYQRGLCVELQHKGMQFAREVRFPVSYRGVNVGSFRADLIVNEMVVVEMKCAESIAREHVRQLLYYLRTANLSTGLILNAGLTASVRRVDR